MATTDKVDLSRITIVRARVSFLISHPQRSRTQACRQDVLHLSSLRRPTAFAGAASLPTPRFARAALRHGRGGGRVTRFRAIHQFVYAGLRRRSFEKTAGRISRRQPCGARQVVHVATFPALRASNIKHCVPMAKPVLLTIDDDPEVLKAIERDLRRQVRADLSGALRQFRARPRSTCWTSCGSAANPWRCSWPITACRR